MILGYSRQIGKSSVEFFLSPLLGLMVYLISVADDRTWEVDEMGRSCVMWLDFRGDDRERKTGVEVSILKVNDMIRTHN